MPWSSAEVEAVVAAYLEMLKLELQGQRFNKRERNRRLVSELASRTPGSVERKHQNISAALIDLGFPWIEGYKPLSNYQRLLSKVVKSQVESEPGLLQLFHEEATASVPIVEPTKDAVSLDALVEPPRTKDYKAYLRRLHSLDIHPQRLNYLALEAENATQGEAGERWVLAYERLRLTRLAREDLADRVEWVSRQEGDHLGFDIRSWEATGNDRLIEVKTTKRGKETPFFVSRNEVRVSRKHNKAYYLYRLFRFRRGPRLFAIRGPLEKSCFLDAYVYEARVG